MCVNTTPISSQCFFCFSRKSYLPDANTKALGSTLKHQPSLEKVPSFATPSVNNPLSSLGRDLTPHKYLGGCSAGSTSKTKGQKEVAARRPVILSQRKRLSTSPRIPGIKGRWKKLSQPNSVAARNSCPADPDRPPPLTIRPHRRPLPRIKHHVCSSRLRGRPRPCPHLSEGVHRCC